MDFAAIFSLENGTFRFIAGTEDPRAINRALAALKQYKDERIRSDKVDLTIIRTTVVEELKTVSINEVLEQDANDETDRLLSMVDCSKT